MDKITRVGVDLSKNVMQVHAVDGAERVVVQKAGARQRFATWLANLKPCLVAMEACGAHYWGRELRALGHDVRLIPPQLRVNQTVEDRFRQLDRRHRRHDCGLPDGIRRLESAKFLAKRAQRGRPARLQYQLRWRRCQPIGVAMRLIIRLLSCFERSFRLTKGFLSVVLVVGNASESP
ncbi:hypothetical protein [Caballeronia arvi]|uniref:hypothetical protein n=1 Tax=Caballeronia arvi TaxID=1777135 RepID=UPI003898EEB8